MTYIRNNYVKNAVYDILDQLRLLPPQQLRPRFTVLAADLLDLEVVQVALLVEVLSVRQVHEEESIEGVTLLLQWELIVHIVVHILVVPQTTIALC